MRYPGAPIVPIPSYELDTLLSQMPCQYRAVEIGKYAVVTLQPAGFELGSCLYLQTEERRLDGSTKPTNRRSKLCETFL